VVPLLRTRPMLVAALVAAAIAAFAHGLPYKLGLMLAALGGVAAGIFAERLYNRSNTREEIIDDAL
jgi:predicted branched-subunit amino acid permease